MHRAIAIGIISVFLLCLAVLTLLWQGLATVTPVPGAPRNSAEVEY